MIPTTNQLGQEQFKNSILKSKATVMDIKINFWPKTFVGIA